MNATTLAGATIVIPGVTGTTLVETYGVSFDTIWSALQKRFETIERLALDASGTFDQSLTTLIEPGVVEALAYGECVGYLRQKLGHPVFLFRYDWRFSCSRNAERLERLVALVLQKCATVKVNFVTHSMGAFVLLAWLRSVPARVHSIARSVLTVPPLRGAAMAISSLIVGESGPLYLNSSTKFRKVARTCPSVYQLVGFYSGCVTRGGTPLSPDQIWDESNWQRRVGGFIDAEHQNQETSKRALMSTHLAAARKFHTSEVLDLDSLSQHEAEKFRILYGTGVGTPFSIDVLPRNTAGDVENFFDFAGFHASEPLGDGDGTVPVESASCLRNVVSHAVPVDVHTTWWNPTTFDDFAKLKLAGYHAAFLGLDKNISMIRDFLAGGDIRPLYIRGIRR